MTTSVDVLAVLNHHANGFSNGPVALSETGAANLANELRQVRAAVAELIEALDIAAYGEYLPESVEQQIRAALDRVTGA